MKALLIAALLISSTAFAREGHEGPEASPLPPSPVIAKLITGSGFVPPTVPSSTVIQIYANGMIDRTLYYRNGKVEVTLIATLAKDVAAKVVATSKAVKETEIRDPQPANPGCTDAPMTRYVAVQGAKEIVIAARENCKELEKVDESDADRSLKRTITAAAALASVLP